jgi:hypothetical protein
MTLTEFLLARIAEDEAAAQADTRPYTWADAIGFITDGYTDRGLEAAHAHAAQWGPLRRPVRVQR